MRGAQWQAVILMTGLAVNIRNDCTWTEHVQRFRGALSESLVM